jgi:hypothetical protein
MFDFEKWREWLKGETVRLAADGFAMEWSPRDKYLRSTCVQGKGHGLISSFRTSKMAWLITRYFPRLALVF